MSFQKGGTMALEARLIRPPENYEIIEMFRYADGQWIRDDGQADLAFFGKAIPRGSQNWFPYAFGFEFLVADDDGEYWDHPRGHPNTIAYESAMNECSKRYGCANGHSEYDPFIEEAEYKVGFYMETVITFSPIKRETPLDEQDAIGNAYGTVPDEVWEQLRSEGWTIREEAQRL
jgi:hypothetical protein